MPLVGEMLAALEVVGLEGPHARLGEEVLRAPRRSTVVEVARVLGHLFKLKSTPVTGSPLQFKT